MKKTILLVEDEQTLRDAYDRILTFEGYKVFPAPNGSEGLELLHQVKPDLILLDVLMPVMDGFEFLRRANLQKDYPGVKIVALTNLSDQNNLETLVSLGVTNHILKSSYSPKELVREVRRLLDDDVKELAATKKTP
jgi:CheY-like chemotaxis protein